MTDSLAAGLEASGLNIKVIRPNEETKVQPNFNLVGDVLQHTVSNSVEQNVKSSKYRSAEQDQINDEWNVVDREYESANNSLHTAQLALQGAMAGGKKNRIEEAKRQCEEEQKKVDQVVTLKRGYSMVWQGDFENQQRASKRLAQVVPISLLLIFLLLFVMFGNLKDAGLVFLNVPTAVVGGILALLITGTNFSISAGIGFIALFGICILEGVLLITAFKRNLEMSRHSESPLYSSIKLGVNELIRPVNARFHEPVAPVRSPEPVGREAE